MNAAGRSACGSGLCDSVGILLDLAARAQAVGAGADDEVVANALRVEERARSPRPGGRSWPRRRTAIALITASCWLVCERLSEVDDPGARDGGAGGQRRGEARSPAGRTLRIALVGAVGTERRLDDHLGLVLVVLEQDALLGHRAANAGDDPVLVDDRDVLGVEEDLATRRAG